MLKITKGLKKKKKGKKNKNKEDDLFDSAELEQYRREQQLKQEQQAAAGSVAETSGEPSGEQTEKGGEEWEKFKALTSGVDDILKKTQGDLDRIKSTSYFQKKTPGTSSTTTESNTAAAEVVKAAAKPVKGKWVGFEDSVNQEEENEVNNDDNVEKPEDVKQAQEEPIVEEVEEEESELEEDQDDIFDTSYVDVVASGEVKLAYVPDSPPLKEDDNFDPFDTSIVDKVIKVDPKKKNLVSLGCAVEVLTGKLDKSPVNPEILKSPRRRPKPQDLLLGSFDEDELPKPGEVEVEPPPKSILDDDPVFEEETSAILDLPPVTPSLGDNKPSAPANVVEEKSSKSLDLDLKTLVEEFVPIGQEEDTVTETVQQAPEEDDLDDEFAALAAESLAKNPPKPDVPNVAGATELENEEDFDEFNAGDDPFDTSFAAQILPGKFELKLIEKEILADDDSTSVKKPAQVLNNPTVDILLTKSSTDFAEPEPLSLKHRDLLGGSTTDLSKIPQCPIVPKAVEETKPKELISDDPFDTSVVNTLVAPGKTELKFLEKELLSDEKPSVQVELDNDFDPRAEEKLTNKPTVPRPDNLEVGGKRIPVPKIVAFDIKSPSNLPDLLAVGAEEGSKISKPLTPYYPPSNVQLDKAEVDVNADPFDTSFVTNNPGKLELQLIEKELTSTDTELKRSLSDPDFDPRAESNLNETNPLPNAKIETTLPVQPDILSEEVQIEAKLHTPVTPRKITEVFEVSEDFDPFDTSIANALAPGKAEIKILETELIYAKETPPVRPINNLLQETLTKKLSETKPPTDVLEQPAEDITVKPLTPVTAASFDQEDIDPFDTSSIGAILPGKTEIKLLESELLN